MTQPTLPAYQPASDDDARLHLAQIVGSDLSIDGIWTGDWHTALHAVDVRYSTPPTDQQPQPAAAA